MNEHDWLAERFEENRPHLRAVAYRMLGSASEADDAVQETWLRLSRSGTGGVENLGGWLTTIVARVSLNMLRTRTLRREEPMDPPVTGQPAAFSAAIVHGAEISVGVERRMWGSTPFLEARWSISSDPRLAPVLSGSLKWFGIHAGARLDLL